MKTVALLLLIVGALTVVGVTFMVIVMSAPAYDAPDQKAAFWIMVLRVGFMVVPLRQMIVMHREKVAILSFFDPAQRRNITDPQISGT